MTAQVFSPVEPPGPLTDNATRAASVNASLTPRFRFAEHSGRHVSQTAGHRGIPMIPALYLDIEVPVSSGQLPALVCSR